LNGVIIGHLHALSIPHNIEIVNQLYIAQERAPY